MTELTLRQFIESTWFKGIARGLMILGGIIFAIGTPIIGGIIGEWRKETASLTENVATMRAEVAASDAATRTSNRATQNRITELTTRVDDMVDDVGLLKGLVQRLDDRPVAVLPRS